MGAYEPSIVLLDGIGRRRKINALSEYLHTLIYFKWEITSLVGGDDSGPDEASECL